MYKPISTYTGRHFDPYHAVAADLDVRDIAHAQSLMTRANGHFPAFYSVGQHSLACAREALVRGEANQTALFCLLHCGAFAFYRRGDPHECPAPATHPGLDAAAL